MPHDAKQSGLTPKNNQKKRPNHAGLCGVGAFGLLQISEIPSQK